MTDTIETDYLVVGAGAAGMAFVDALVAESGADVVMVDRRHAPGGHWNDAYPFVRLHQPSATYGIGSLPLGRETIDASGPNAGFYERATGVEICAYFRRALEDHLLPSGQVRFYGGSDYVGDWGDRHVVTSRLTGLTTTVRVRRKVVDGTYLETSVPATHRPSFSVDDDARLIPVGELVDVAGAPTGFTVLGAGKTAMDACCWLLDNGVDPGRIRWVRPRDAWLMDRASVQPLDLVVSTIEGLSLSVEALASAESTEDLFRRLEACGQLSRLDGTTTPTMFRGAILSETERATLRQIEHVVRLGRVVHLGRDRIALDQGTIPTGAGDVRVDCTASGFRRAPARPIFAPRRITIQSLQGGYTTFNAALVGFIEASRDDDGEKNRLCPPNPQPSDDVDWIRIMSDALRAHALHAAEPDVMTWREQSRLSMTRGLADHAGDPRLQSALGRWLEHIEPALRNPAALISSRAASPSRLPA